MLDGIGKALDLVDALWRYLHRLDVLNAAPISTHGAEVDRPAVGDATHRLTNLPGSDVLQRLVIDHVLVTAGVDVHHGDGWWPAANDTIGRCEP